jgi:hypothetical protein
MGWLDEAATRRKKTKPSRFTMRSPALDEGAIPTGRSFYDEHLDEAVL